MIGPRDVATVLPVAVLDANVLYPQFLRDVLLRLAADDLYRPRWTPRITDEWVRNVARDRAIPRAMLAGTVALMDRAFPAALVTGYEHLESAFPGVHRNDRHVAAAALAGGATLIVTWNRRDFPQNSLTPHGMQCVNPDELLIDLLTADATTVIAALERHRVGLHRPPHDPAAYRRAFVAAGLTRAAERLP